MKVRHLYTLCFALIAAQAAPSVSAAKPENKSLVQTIAASQNRSIVGDAFGRTLYTFDVDLGNNTSKCEGDCALIWPPYLLTAREAGGLSHPLGSIKRTGDRIQLTFNGHPVYTYAFDRFVGDEQGDGLGNVWHTVLPLK